MKNVVNILTVTCALAAVSPLALAQEAPDTCKIKLADKNHPIPEQTLKVEQIINFEGSNVFIQDGKVVGKPASGNSYCSIALSGVNPKAQQQFPVGRQLKINKLASIFYTVSCYIGPYPTTGCPDPKYGVDEWDCPFGQVNKSGAQRCDKQIASDKNYEITLSAEKGHVKALKCFNVKTFQDLHDALEGKNSDGIISGFECPKVVIEEVLNSKTKSGENNSSEESAVANGQFHKGEAENAATGEKQGGSKAKSAE